MSYKPPSEKHFALIRVLIALAWADGEISNEETNFLKDFFFKFDFTGEDWARIEIYLEDPIPPEEAEVLIKDFVQRLSGAKEREAVIKMLEDLMAVDGLSRPEEADFLARCVSTFRGTGTASSLMGRFKGLFRETLLKPAGTSSRREELDDFLNNRVLFKLRRKLEREKLSIEADPERLAYAALFAGLLGHVAAAQGGVCEEEVAVLRGHLEKISDFDSEAVALILSVLEEATIKGLDVFRLTRSFYEKSSKAQREQLVDCLFDVAGADKDLAHVEVEAIREIAYGLKFSHREFINAKTRFRERAAGIAPS